ncbi:hypothetical protein ACEWY4_018662 [Coilia grayii]|uniref:Ig-like domain-containing protein n=1 Tax=Coilia grayii TaxID=363190 RepID=A0ABD1JDV0_9TELE
MPTTLETIQNSCVLIPCSFVAKASSVEGPAAGVWRKDSQWFVGGVDVFNSSNARNKLHGEILGDLAKWNCTSVLYNFTKHYEGQYFFRLESIEKYTFAEHVSIKVNDGLPSPHLTSPQRPLQEGVLAHMTCVVASHCPRDPPGLVWSPALNHSADSLRTKDDGTQEVVSVLSFVPSRKHDGLNVSCVVTHRLLRRSQDTVQETARLHVHYGPKNVSVSLNPSRLVIGSPVTLSCLGVSNPPISSYRWFWNSSGSMVELEWTSQSVTLMVSDSKAGVYHCEGANSVGASNSSALQLEVPVSVNSEQASIEIWIGIGSGCVVLVLLCGVFLCHRCRKPQSQQRNGMQPWDIYVNVTKGSQNTAGSTPNDPEDSLYCNQPPPNTTKANRSKVIQTSDDIYANC